MEEVSTPRDDDAIWIEVLSRHHEVVSRQRFVELPIRIGRAYDNDVVVDDAHVAAHHVRIARADDGALIAEDLGSRNGIVVGRSRERRTRVVVDATQPICIGTTSLRIRTAAYAVPDEVALTRSGSHWPLALASFATVFAIAVIELWLGETAEPKAVRYLAPLLILAVGVGVWTAGWSVLGRVFTGQARFGLHFLIVAVGLLIFSIYDQAAEIGAFALSWTSLATTAYVVAWLVLGGICLAHLLAIGRARSVVKIGIVAIIVVAGIAMQTLKLREYRSTYGQPVTLRRLEPPVLRQVSVQSESTFFSDAQTLRAKLDAARSEEPDGDDAAAGNGDD